MDVPHSVTEMRHLIENEHAMNHKTPQSTHHVGVPRQSWLLRRTLKTALRMYVLLLKDDKKRRAQRHSM